ncbi:MAG: hypothetical protein IT428_07005 [Planctomycetaceae bacterium]|nr:hypothetical protein [Planctomycetaceae bacterium]
MSPQDAGKFIHARIVMTRDDIARAKAWILETRAAGQADSQASRWLKEQRIDEPREIATNAANCDELLANAARAYSLRASFYQAVWEMSVSGHLIVTGDAELWAPQVTYRTSHGAGGIEIPKAPNPKPATYLHLKSPDDTPRDPDVFLKGVNCSTLHSGIREAIEQALGCFRRGLYMPATAMLAAGAEAAWTECGTEVARHLSNSKLDAIMTDSYASISKKVAETRKALEHGDAKTLLKTAGRTSANIDEAHVWTTVLRDRRNALHWGKAKSFVADHSETASLLMGAPLHLATLEAIRAAC